MLSPHSVWFALNARKQREIHVSTLLHSKGYETFVPLSKIQRRWSDRIKIIEQPLFPGYLFSRFDLRNKTSVLTVPGVLSIVGIGKTPAPVEEDEITALRTLVKSGLPACACSYLEIGKRIRIEEGPLRGLHGTVLDCAAEKKKLIISITLLQRSVAVNINPRWVTTAHCL